ncbi:hypothetical protein DYB32_000111 [Aphanomyces invadans]|uniref:EF-hand domain-containing protein n=1 Tax=Aphanomyces invadans TaxID=157072 RepID=A0A3R6ZBI0_9STRA|nr:hypothetical protein DYB32_000111 [Aphanomyces invadans]
MLYPDAIHINRGNHEDEFMNSVHSFRREVLVKYDADMCEAFNAVFDALPLAHVVNDSLFVVHGGLSETPLTIDQVRETLHAAPSEVELDPDTLGTRITVDAWAQVLRKVLALDLDWKELAPHMTTVDADGNVDCDEFLSSFCAVYEGVRGPVSTSVCEPHARGQQPEWRGVFDALYPHRKALEAIFCFFDRDHSGAISMDEFKQGCLLLNEHLPLSDRWKDPIALFRDMDMYGIRSAVDILVSHAETCRFI